MAHGVHVYYILYGSGSPQRSMTRSVAMKMGKGPSKVNPLQIKLTEYELNYITIA